MADDTDTKVEEPKKEEEPVKVDPLPNLDHASRSDITNLERKLRDEMTQLTRGHSEEREELKHQLKELQDWKAEQDKAQHDRDKVKESSSTIVLPPEDVPPQQPNPAPSNEPVSEEGKKVPFWKKAW